VRHEPLRYYKWYTGNAMSADVPRTLLHLFQVLAAIAFVYLLIRFVIYLKRGNAMSESRGTVLTVTVIAVLFFGVVTGRKAVYYMAHLAPWFALMAGVLISDSLGLLERWRSTRLKQWPRQRLANAAVIGIVAVLSLAFAQQLYKQNKRYLRVTRNPDLASFEEFKIAIRSLVPEGVCPVVVREPVIWLAFPEHDRCFANIQERMKKAVDVDGNEYVLIVSPKLSHHWLKAVAPNHHYLLGEILDSPYGSFQVYYTGVDPRWLALQPIRYQLFGNRRGCTSDKLISSAREVWPISASDQSESQRGN
jgi:hypothetical protein